MHLPEAQLTGPDEVNPPQNLNFEYDSEGVRDFKVSIQARVTPAMCSTCVPLEDQRSS